MIVFNTYIAQLPREKAVFLAELQGFKFFLKAERTIAKVGSNFVNEVKQKSN